MYKPKLHHFSPSIKPLCAKTSSSHCIYHELIYTIRHMSLRGLSKGAKEKKKCPHLNYKFTNPVIALPVCSLLSPLPMVVDVTANCCCHCHTVVTSLFHQLSLDPSFTEDAIVMGEANVAAIDDCIVEHGKGRDMREHAGKPMVGFANLQFERKHFCLLMPSVTSSIEFVGQCRRARLPLPRIAIYPYCHCQYSFLA